MRHTAGKWLSIDRGAAVPDATGTPDDPAQIELYPLALRLTEAEVAELWQYRETLPPCLPGSIAAA